MGKPHTQPHTHGHIPLLSHCEGPWLYDKYLRLRNMSHCASSDVHTLWSPQPEIFITYRTEVEMVTSTPRWMAAPESYTKSMGPCHCHLLPIINCVWGVSSLVAELNIYLGCTGESAPFFPPSSIIPFPVSGPRLSSLEFGDKNLFINQFLCVLMTVPIVKIIRSSKCNSTNSSK